MLTKNIKFKNFIRKKNPRINKILKNIINDKVLLEKLIYNFAVTKNPHRATEYTKTIFICVF